MNDKSVEYIKKSIHFLDKISYIPALSVSIIFFIFFLKILVNPFDWIYLSSTYLLGSIIGFLFFIYDKNYISPMIYNEEFDYILLDALCLGIIGCIFHGIGIILLIKGVFILILNIDKDFLSNTNEKNIYHQNLRLNLYYSLSSISSRAGLVIIMMVFYYQGISLILNVFNQLIIGNFQIIFESFYIFLIISVLILIFDHNNEELVNGISDLNAKLGGKELIKGILACCFYATGIFILFRGIILISFPEDKVDLSYNKIKKKEKDLVIYSN